MSTAPLLRVVIDTNVQATPVEEINQQQQAFQVLLQDLGQASSTQIKSALDKREAVQPEEALSPEIIVSLQQRIRNASKA